MSEIIIRAKNKSNADPYANAKLFQRGDVIAVCADGWGWSVAELTSPEWRIAKLPNVTELQAAAFIGAELDSDPQHPSKMLRPRAFYLDIDDITWPAGIKAWFLDDTRAQQTRTFTQTLAQILAFKKAKTPLADPGIL